MTGQLNNIQINNLLSSQAIGRLACTDGKHPYIIPVTFNYDGEYIYGQTNEGKKLEILRKNPNVCFEVDVMTDMANWQSVVVYGKFEELEDEEALKARETLFGNVFSLMTHNSVHVHQHEYEGKLELEESTRHKLVMYRIKMGKVTGRFEKQ